MHQMPHSHVIPFQGILPKLSPGVLICTGAVVIGDVTIGKDSNVWFNTVMRGDVQKIEVGEGCNIQDNTTVHVTNKVGPVKIGSFVTVGHNATIHACTIDNYVLIGMGSTVLDNAHIPERCLVGAGSVVTASQQFEPGHLIVGSPAKAVRKLKDSEFEFLEKSAVHYIQLAKKYM